jgi:hypothetical protein
VRGFFLREVMDGGWWAMVGWLERGLTSVRVPFEAFSVTGSVPTGLVHYWETFEGVGLP